MGAVTGLLAYSIQLRLKEIAIRLALGAPAALIQRTLIGRAMLWVAAGIPLGTAGAWPLRTALDSFLFRSSVSDARVWTAALLVLVVTAAAAAYVPAVRASHTKIVDALRLD